MLEGPAHAVAAKRTDVTVTGYQPPELVGAAIESSTAVLVPSLWEEPFGLVAVEAFAHGRPVLSTGAGGLADVLSEDCAWIVPPDPDRWATALGAVTVQQARLKGVRARERYDRLYKPETVTKQLIAIYHGVGSGKQRRGGQ